MGAAALPFGTPAAIFHRCGWEEMIGRVWQSKAKLLKVSFCGPPTDRRSAFAPTPARSSFHRY